MRASEHLQDRKWQRPDYYGGFNPEGDFVILTRHRDSDLVEDTNYVAACDLLKAEDYDDGDLYEGPEDLDPERPNVYTFRAGHWAVGWVEYLMVRADAPEDVLEAAGDIVCSLEYYPVLDDEELSRREWEETEEAWRWLSRRERIELCTKIGASIFAARRDEVPRGNGYGASIQEHLGIYG